MDESPNARTTVTAAVAVALLLGPAAVHAEEGEKPDVRAAVQGGATPIDSSFPSPPTAAEERAHEALELGLRWLAQRQKESLDGSFPATLGVRVHPKIGVTALAALAYMAGGSTIDRGPYGRELAAAIEYLLSKVDLDTAEPAWRGFISDSADTLSRNHGHGFACLALAEAYSMSPASPLGRRIAEALVEAVHNIERSQGFEGGWYYYPTDRGQHEGSTTICLVQALRAARNAGIKVDTSVIKKAVDYVARSQKPDGSFRYAFGNDRSSVALTAAALSTLNASGTYRGKIIDAGYEYIWRELVAREQGNYKADEPNRNTFPYYERLYLAQSLFQHQDEKVFRSWFAREREGVLDAQRPDGSWEDETYGHCYATAVNCLVLALPEGLLPIFQR